MAKKGGENSKKVAGNARKAEAAAQKAAAADASRAAEEDAYWDEGSKKKSGKKEDAEAKKEEARRRKEEREAELAAEAETMASKPASSKNKGHNKIVSKQGRGIDAALSSSEPGLSAHNIEDAISALDIAAGRNTDKIDRHPERRFKAAFKAYEERRMPELREERKGLRLTQYRELIYKEFEKSNENPFNQVTVAHNASQEEVKDTLKNVRSQKESRLAH